MNDPTTPLKPPTEQPPPAPPPLPAVPAQPLVSALPIAFPQQPTVIKPVTLVFVGPITNPAAKNLRGACANFVTTGMKEIQILFSSNGGALDEAFALYNFLRALPITLTMQAIGFVDSAAMAVFLAGERRFCTADSTFLFHDLAWGTPNAINQTRSQWADLNIGLERLKIRSQELLKSRTAFTDEDFKAMQLYDKTTIQDASFAKQKGVVQEIKEASIPAGSIVANIDI